jgi:chemosensory pili system protein ChpC
MTNSQVAKSSQVADIPCLLLPLHGRLLLVPTVTVAEMVPMAPYQDAEEDSPDWLLGYFQWRGQDVPLLSFERLAGEAETSVVAKGRVAVLNNTGVSDGLPFIAVPTTGIPRMSRVSPEDIKEDPDAPKKPFELMRVKIGLEEFTIPDVTALENVYLEWRGKLEQ